MATVQEDKTTSIRILSSEEQALFFIQAERNIAHVMRMLNQYFWKHKPKMLNPRSVSAADRYISYRRPRIKQQVSRPEIGVSAFVTVEQINHWRGEPQLQYYLYVLTARSGVPERKVVDQGYELEGDATISILEVEQEYIVINTKSGKMTILL
ncbi:MAG: hypothetical protein UV60_C0008G0028 [Parcubacteria group bacterium GW2011_GWA2_43_11]|nr:MAG: hypothetical protein UU89_C0009G0022 [Parcubacteria group bacterium GW2011_GWC2_42_11]KKS85406.1 MAG: hypothetical protein UV60_C0008G0028 [Parcubacteria group bacterium GW2011_GWA2_43_11]